MAQMVVRLPGRHEVVGSNPCSCVTFLAENIPVLSGHLVHICQLLFSSINSGVSRILSKLKKISVNPTSPVRRSSEYIIESTVTTKKIAEFYNSNSTENHRSSRGEKIKILRSLWGNRKESNKILFVTSILYQRAKDHRKPLIFA